MNVCDICMYRHEYVNINVCEYVYIYNVYICMNMYVTYCIYTYSVSTHILEMNFAEYREL